MSEFSAPLQSRYNVACPFQYCETVNKSGGKQATCRCQSILHNKRVTSSSWHANVTYPICRTCTLGYGGSNTLQFVTSPGVASWSRRRRERYRCLAGQALPNLGSHCPKRYSPRSMFLPTPPEHMRLGPNTMGSEYQRSQTQ